MEDTKRYVTVGHLASSLRAHGSWGGETHLQKAIYMLQELCSVPIGYQFILYKHGPFSFDLRDDINIMISSGLLESENHPPYGPSLIATPAESRLEDGFSKTIEHTRSAIEFVAGTVGNDGVADLEKSATSLFLIQRTPSLDDQSLAEELNRLKPHVDVEDGLEAIQRMRKAILDAPG